MNEIKIFQNAEFGSVRTIVIDNEPWLVGKDVAVALGYSDAFGALKKHVDTDDKLVCQIDSAGQKRDVTAINESGLYSLILSSKLPTAKKFKHWVTSEVLPSIRKTGTYGNQKTSYLAEPALAMGVARLINTLRKVMKDQKSNPQKIAVMTKTVCDQFGVNLPENFVEKDPFENQLFLLGFKMT